MRDRVLLESAALAHWNGFPCQKRFIAFEPLGPQHQRVRRDPVPFVKNEDLALNDLAARHAHGPAIAHDNQIGRASCRESGWQYVSISVVGVSLKKKKTLCNSRQQQRTNT